MHIPAKFHGLCLALTTVVFWGTLPIALKQVVTSVDVFTIVWLRFATIAIWMWIFLPHKAEGRMFLPLVHMFDHNPQLHRLVASGPYNRKKTMALLLMAAAGLGSNFVLYNFSVSYLNPSACQILAQAGPMLLMLGSVVVLHEPLRRIQVLGIPVLVAGTLLFFNQNLDELLKFSGNTAIGVVIGLAASFVWACYGLAQKILLREMASKRLMRFLYTVIALALLPFATPSHLLNIDSFFQALCLAYCCMNTAVAYGALSQAMVTWDTAKVSAVLTTTPLATLFFALVAHFVAPDTFTSEKLNLMALIGAFVTVLGAALIAVGPHLKRLLHHKE